jgi:hypothetical protein
MSVKGSLMHESFLSLSLLLLFLYLLSVQSSISLLQSAKTAASLGLPSQHPRDSTNVPLGEVPSSVKVTEAIGLQLTLRTGSR